MTENLWNNYDISLKWPEVPVKRSPKMVSKERALTLNAPGIPLQWVVVVIIIIIIIINDVQIIVTLS